MEMPFGKYKGDDLGNIPNSYLEWLLDKDINEDISYEIEKELNDREIHKIYIKD